jgi:hypothetical protein
MQTYADLPRAFQASFTEPPSRRRISHLVLTNRHMVKSRMPQRTQLAAPPKSPPPDNLMVYGSGVGGTELATYIRDRNLYSDIIIKVVTSCAS